jgi:hypothetical protein
LVIPRIEDRTQQETFRRAAAAWTKNELADESERDRAVAEFDTDGEGYTAT